MEGQDEAVKTGLEDQINPEVHEGGAGAQDKVEKQDQASSDGASGATQNVKGSWLTSAPKDIRETVDADKYPGIWDYVRDLKSRAEGKAGSAATDEAFAEEWKDYLNGDGNGGNPILDAMNAALQGEGISASAAKKAAEAIRSASEKSVEGTQRSLADARAKRAREYIQKSWGDTKEEREGNLALYQRCAGLMAKEKPEAFAFLRDSELLSEPAVVDLVMGLYSQRQEVIPPSGSPGGAESVPGDRYGIV